MAPSVSLLYILFTVGFLSKCSTGVPQLELGLHFVEEPRDVTGIKGKSLALPCRIKTNHPKESLEVKWYHNDKQMDLANDKRRRTIFQNGTLYFSRLIHKRAGRSDQGEYRCVVIGDNGSLSSKPGFLRISVLPENFTRHPMEQNVEAGSNVRLSCGIDSVPELEIGWVRNDHKLPQNVLKYAVVSGPDVRGSVLYIFNVVPDDSGSYRCAAKNVLLNKQRYSSNGILTVLPRENDYSHRTLTFLSAQRPFSSSFFTNLKEVKEGDDVTLDCVANGFPAPILSWNYLQRGWDKPQKVFNVTTTGYNIVYIKNVTRHQAGWYTCSAMNSSKKGFTTELKVITGPEITEKSENIVFRASKTVRFRCLAYGYPVPEIDWLKDGNMLNITGRIKHRTSVNESQELRLSELIVSSTVTSDAGIYQCMAKNSAGSTWAASRLFLNATEPAPGAPEKVSCQPLSSSKIRLTWDVPDTVNKIKAFSIHYHLTDNGEEMQKVMTSDYRSTEIDKLLPFTNYTFYARLYIDSASEFSEKTVCQTGEEVPIEAPKKTLKIISPNLVQVSWFPLRKEKARGVINQYKIQWRVNGSPSARVEEVTGDVLEYTITGLIPGKKYDVRVLAATSKGWPDFDLPWETFEIPLNYNSDIPSAPEVVLQAFNSSSIEINWSLPDRGSELIGYKIFYRKHNSNRLGPIVVPSDIHQHILLGLDPETWYEVMVLGFSKSGDGETGISSVHTLSDDGSSGRMAVDFASVIEPPAFLEAEPVSPGAINLSWSPSQTTSLLNYYTVCYNPVQTSRNKNPNVTCVKSLENKIKISGLQPYTLYEFKVRSHNVNGKESSFSQAIECHTLEDVPSHVLDINWKALNKTTVQVMWKEPRQSNGIIKNYTLYYTQDSNMPLHLWHIKIVPAGVFKTQLTDLISNEKYYLIVRASTSAGLGSYGSPKQMLIPSLNSVPRNDPSPKTSKDKQTDHYIGIMVGLGIGLCCIILCTTCILCRRRCLKGEVSQELEAMSSRHSNGNDCHRGREMVTESRETEYFTFLSSHRERPNGMEIAVQHIDTKGHYPNGSANGIRLSLLSESRTSNGSYGKTIYITENPRYDPNSSESPLLSSRPYSFSSRRGSETKQNFKVNGEPKSPPHTRNRKLSESEVPFTSSTVDSEHGNSEKTSPTHSESEFFIAEKGSEIVQNCIETNQVEKTKPKEDELWANVNNVLKNPDFRFSDTNSFNKAVKRKNGFTLPSHYCNGRIQVNGFDDASPGHGSENNRNEIHGVYKNSKILHLVSKEITQES